jgi:hypothetical protein
MHILSCNSDFDAIKSTRFAPKECNKIDFKVKPAIMQISFFFLRGNIESAFVILQRAKAINNRTSVEISHEAKKL